jgi:hypothetical protein
LGSIRHRHALVRGAVALAVAAQLGGPASRRWTRPTATEPSCWRASGSWKTPTKVKGGSKLRPPDTATTVRLDRGDPVVLDGPFVEGKEVVSGYAEVEADNLDDVLAIVTTWPGCPVVEIRPLES